MDKSAGDESALQESRDQLAFAIEAAQLGTWDYNPLTNKFSANDRLKKWFGLPPGEQIELKHAIEAIVEKDRQRVNRAIQRSLEFSSGGNYDIEYTIINLATKKETDVRAKGKAWFNEDKIAYRFNGILEDITEQKTAHRKILQSERNIHNMVLEAPIGICLLDASSLVSEIVNDSFIEVAGKPYEAIVGKFYWETFAEARPYYETALKKVVEEGLPYYANEVPMMLIRHGKEENIYVTFVYSPLKNAEGKVEKVAVWVLENTQQVVARQNIQKSTDKLNIVIAASELGTFELNLKNDVVDCSERFHQIFGYVNGERLNHTEFLSHLHPDDVSTRNEAFKKAIDSGSLHYQSRVFSKNGSVKWIEVRGQIFYDEQRNPSLLIGTCRDFTEEKSRQQELEEKGEKLNLIINASDLGTWELDLITGIAVYSDRYLEILGNTKGNKLSHAQLLKYLHPEDRPARDTAMDLAFKTGILYFQCRLIWDDHSIHWIEAKGRVFYDDEKKPVKIVGTVRDITDQLSHQKELEESEQKFRLLADSMPQFVWTGDRDGNLNYFNQSVYKYSGLTPEQVQKDGWIQIVHPDEREENIVQWIHSIKTGQDFNFEHRFRRHDGEYRWQLSRAIPQKDTNGNIQMWVGTSTDIQHQKTFARELEKQVSERTSELEQKNMELEKMNIELQSFAYVSSHDLQEPLRKIQTFTSFLLEKESGNLSEKGKEYFSRIQGSAKRMQRLIEDLITYSRTNSSERILHKTNLSDILEEVKNDLREAISEKNAIIVAGELCTVNIIPFQFRQLLNNMIGNSLKFSKPGVQPVIKIKAEIQEGDKLQNDSLTTGKKYCHLTISDNGIGFEQEYKDRIFEVFQRLHLKDEYTGTGIGLSIVKRIVDNHHGIIKATGKLNEGATFDIYIPA